MHSNSVSNFVPSDIVPSDSFVTPLLGENVDTEMAAVPLPAQSSHSRTVLFTREENALRDGWEKIRTSTLLPYTTIRQLEKSYILQFLQQFAGLNTPILAAPVYLNDLFKELDTFREDIASQNLNEKKFQEKFAERLAEKFSIQTREKNPHLTIQIPSPSKEQEILPPRIPPTPGLWDWFWGKIVEFCHSLQSCFTCQPRSSTTATILSLTDEDFLKRTPSVSRTTPPPTPITEIDNRTPASTYNDGESPFRDINEIKNGFSEKATTPRPPFSP